MSDKLKVKVGRPRKYETPEELAGKINEYLESETQPTMAGMCNYLQITRETLSSYGQGEVHPEFPDIVKSARQAVEAIVEGRLLYGSNVTGPLFWLKNHAGYKDARHLAGSEDDEPIKIVFDRQEQNLL